MTQSPPPPTGLIQARPLRALTALAAVALITATACGQSASGSHQPDSNTQWSAVTSTQAAGGIEALTSAAKQEGALNLYATPRDWANYGGLIDAFSKKYGIKVSVSNPEGSSKDGLNACEQLKATSRAPDSLEFGTSFAPEGIQRKVFAPYKVERWGDVPAEEKDPQGLWIFNYGGVMSIGYSSKDIPTAPTGFRSLLDPAFKNAVSLTGSPTSAGGAFGAVNAAALANGGSLDDVQPGIDFFAKLQHAGNFNPAVSTPAGIESGQIKVALSWSFLNTGWASINSSWKTVIPQDAPYIGYYAQAVCANASHPAAARLWQEFLYSPEGQNLWIKGGARPVLIDALLKSGDIDQQAYNALPPVTGKLQFPNAAQQARAQATINANWSKDVGSA